MRQSLHATTQPREERPRWRWLVVRALLVLLALGAFAPAALAGEGASGAAAHASQVAPSAASQPDALSTYRIQLTPQFPFSKAREMLPYLKSLGIRTVYLSPVLQARSGSLHGYDVTDPTRVNAELGGEPEFLSLVRDAKKYGLSMAIDVVPNHMGTGSENALWESVLTHGQASPHARMFDIDWGNGGKKVALPVLGGTPEALVAKHEFKVSYENDGSFRLRYYDKSFPIDPKSAATVLLRSSDAPPALAEKLQKLASLGPRTPGDATRADDATRALGAVRALYDSDPATRRSVDASLASYNDASAEPARWSKLLGAQAYRLVDWKTANTAVNYRRFFSINDLAAVRIEDPAVFETVLDKTLSLVRVAKDAGVTLHLRIDHPDGLADPGKTMSALRTRLTGINPQSQIWTESILAKEQHLSPSWRASGTTGYDFLNQLGRVAVDKEGFDRIDAWYRQNILKNPTASFSTEVDAGKRRMLATELAPDLEFLVDKLEQSASSAGKRPSRSDIREVVSKAITALPVYRTYLNPGSKPSAEDVARVTDALSAVAPDTEGKRAAVALVRGALLDGDASSPFVKRFQQLSAATMAKGLEDTAHYRYYPVAALNEVGGNPEDLSSHSIEEFHAASQARDPRAMLAASTHDTKRSADARARLAVLTWKPESWISEVQHWQTMNRPIRGRVDANTEYLAYQTLVALWPGGGEPTPSQLADLKSRVSEYMVKAAREGKANTSWTAPNEAYERDLRGFVNGMFEGAPGAKGQKPFVSTLGAFVSRIDRPASMLALSQAVAHYTAPGTPDTYQGDEIWNRTVVDPDNRRAVDPTALKQVLAQVEEFDHLDRRGRAAFVQRLFDDPSADEAKLHVVRRALLARSASPALFAQGRYTPLATRGSSPVLAFARQDAERFAITLAPQGQGHASAVIPAELRGARVTDQVTGRTSTLGATARVAGGVPRLLVGRVPAARPAARVAPPSVTPAPSAARPPAAPAPGAAPARGRP